MVPWLFFVCDSTRSQPEFAAGARGRTASEEDSSDKQTKKRIAEGSSSSSSQSFFIRECRIVAASRATAANSCVVCIALVSRRGRVVEDEPVHNEAGRDQCSKLPTERTTIHSSCHQSRINEWEPEIQCKEKRGSAHIGVPVLGTKRVRLRPRLCCDQ